MLPKIVLSNRQSELGGVAGTRGAEEVLKRPAAGQVDPDTASCLANACTDLE
jgi:hypothetical protein